MKLIFATTLFLASVMAMPSQLAAAPDATTEIGYVQGAQSGPQNDVSKRDLVKESREAANEFCSGYLGYCSDTVKCCDGRICTRCVGDTAPINICHPAQCEAFKA
ncbi:uncharacterized protein EAE97_010817 [Botrytis byssoidea]|uniref:Uncharacterized protein n=1 Tax=Botrytis byssoidea TaxID=139641 RepID=A0A9P5I2M3_9HELO|nr:uncharacterized protein EAE97_010817 [Botrytis byssoidea]KAF7923379.1 hypothetical protein EAE97_010817 [Botrytis byssoidea]